MNAVKLPGEAKQNNLTPECGQPIDAGGFGQFERAFSDQHKHLQSVVQDYRGVQKWRRCDARIWRESGAYVTQILRAKVADDVRHVARVHHANVARTCRARTAQQGMLLLDPSVTSPDSAVVFFPSIMISRKIRINDQLWFNHDSCATDQLRIFHVSRLAFHDLAK
jgi:hypothetical protein